MLGVHATKEMPCRWLRQQLPHLFGCVVRHNPEKLPEVDGLVAKCGEANRFVPLPFDRLSAACPLPIPDLTAASPPFPDLRIYCHCRSFELQLSLHHRAFCRPPPPSPPAPRYGEVELLRMVRKKYRTPVDPWRRTEIVNLYAEHNKVWRGALSASLQNSTNGHDHPPTVNWTLEPLPFSCGRAD